MSKVSKVSKGNQPIAIFHKEGHKYFINGKRGYSVNRVKDFFKDPLDQGYWQTYKAIELAIGVEEFKHLKKKEFKYPLISKPPMSWLVNLANFRLTPAEFFEYKNQIKQKWKDSQTDGTKFHDDRENELYERGYAINPWDKNKYTVKKFEKQYDNQSIISDLSELEDGCYPELLVWLEVGDIYITGQIDLPYIGTEGGVRYTDVDDYKTNAKLTRTSSYKYHKPFQHLDTSKITNYSIQMSGYQYILECWGYQPRNTALTHYKDYDPSTGKRYELKYYRDEVKLMFETFAKIHGNVK